MTTNFKEIELLVVAALKERLPYLGTVETVDPDTMREIEKEKYKYPAALVLYSGSSFSPVDGTAIQEDAKFSIFCASRTNRGKRAGRVGASGGVEKGVFDILQDVKDALINENFNLPEICSFIPVRVEAIVTTDRLSVYGIEFTTSFDTDYDNR